MCKVVTYIVTDAMLVISLSLACSQFYYQFYIETESKTLYHLTGSTHLQASFSSFSSGSIVTPTPTVTLGK